MTKLKVGDYVYKAYNAKIIGTVLEVTPLEIKVLWSNGNIGSERSWMINSFTEHIAKMRHTLYNHTQRLQKLLQVNNLGICLYCGNIEPANKMVMLTGNDVACKNCLLR